MTARFSKHWPAIAALFLLLITVIVLLVRCWRAAHGHFVYALDDAYIHLSLAGNLATHGVWGVTRYEFASASSSPLWTLTLAGIFRVIGVREIVPFVLNILFACLTVATGYAYAVRRELPRSHTFVIVFAMMFAAPLPFLVFTGMEHSMHCFFAVLFTMQACDLLFGKLTRATNRSFILLAATALLLPAARYEGLFMVFVVCVLLALRRRLWQAIILGTAALVPVVIYGCISHHLGSFWLPNSIMVKADLTSMSDAHASIRDDLWRMYDRAVYRAPHLTYLVLAALVIYIRRLQTGKSVWDRQQTAIAIFAGTALLHIALAQVGWFYRYEAYLVCLGVFVIGLALSESVARLDVRRAVPPLLAAGVILVAALPTFYTVKRSATAIRDVPKASRNIYEQQYQMGLFLRQYYQGQSVAANDIGAINYLADIKCLDLKALGSVEVARLRLSGRFDTDTLNDLCLAHGVKAAIIYDGWFWNDIHKPASWQEVGRWTIRDNVVCAFDTVSFYAVDPSETPRLAACFNEFSANLPPGVRVTYLVDRP